MASYQAHRARFEALDAHVLGMSPDASPSKVAWSKSLGGITFDLLSDFHPQNAVARLYGVEREGGTPARAVFIVDKAGRIAFAKLYDVDRMPDPAELLGALEGLCG